MSVPSVSRIISGVDNHFKIQGGVKARALSKRHPQKKHLGNPDTITDVMKYLRPDKRAMKKPDSITRVHMVLRKRIRWVYP